MVEIVAANDDRTPLELEVAAYDRRSRIEEAMVQHIARRIASPFVPHYDHIFTARKMLGYLQECATVEPMAKFEWQRDLFKEQPASEPAGE